MIEQSSMQESALKDEIKSLKERINELEQHLKYELMLKDQIDARKDKYIETL